jgi:hypothetical protein
MNRKKTGATKNIREIQRLENVTVELGRESVTATSKLILCVRSANEMENLLLRMKFITSFLYRKVVRTRRAT